MAKRIAWTIALVAAIAIAYLVLAFAGLAPRPRSIESLARASGPERGYALVSGYYMEQPFVANGAGLPPYTFGERNAPNGALRSVYIVPILSDLRAYRVVAVIDTQTGDGTQWNPYVIRTIGSVTTVVLAAAAGGLMLVALLIWLAGAGAAAPRAVRAPLRRASG